MSKVDIKNLVTNLESLAEKHGLVYETKINGVTMAVDFKTMHESWLDSFLLKAAQRRINDDLSGMESDAKEKEARKLFTAINAGEEKPYKVTVTKATTDPIRALARKRAKEFLGRHFKKIGFGSKKAEWVVHDDAAKYFSEHDAWIDPEVDAFMDRNKDVADVPDFMANAKTELEAEAKVSEKVKL